MISDSTSVVIFSISFSFSFLDPSEPSPSSIHPSVVSIAHPRILFINHVEAQRRTMRGIQH